MMRYLSCCLDISTSHKAEYIGVVSGSPSALVLSKVVTGCLVRRIDRMKPGYQQKLINKVRGEYK